MFIRYSGPEALFWFAQKKINFLLCYARLNAEMYFSEFAFRTLLKTEI